MSEDFLLDTNIIAYALDIRESEKQGRAKEILRRLADDGSGVLPSQALSEFANVCLNKFRPRLDPEQVEREIEKLILAFPVMPLTARIALEALRGVRVHRMPYYDAQIWAFARLGQIPTVLSEDFNPGATIEGVTFLDPLREGFEVESLG